MVSTEAFSESRAVPENVAVAAENTLAVGVCSPPTAEARVEVLQLSCFGVSWPGQN